MAAAGTEEGDSLDSDSDDLLIDGDNDDEVRNSVARWQNLMPSFPWIAPGWGRNPRKGRDQILQSCVAEP